MKYLREDDDFVDTELNNNLNGNLFPSFFYGGLGGKEE